uniref:Uncharacterized protein n=1 Tax=Rhizophora mucronata TaxID=61149 RepID=A0A2P2PYZ5_RHIMU
MDHNEQGGLIQYWF